MKILNPLLLNCVTRLDITFADGNGNEKKIWGTGFWISQLDNSLVLITNRHNFEPVLKNKEYSGYKLAKLKILLRQQDNNGFFTRITDYFALNLATINGLVHPKADVAIISNPQALLFDQSIQGYQNPVSLHLSEIADNAFFSSWCEMFDPLGFIGFPREWYDHDSNSPIGRMAYISSNPCSFSNIHIKTTDVMLVTGLSFEGSSGSPVFFLPKGLNITGGSGININSSHTLPKLVGIMSGHWDDAKSNLNTGFIHSGLSYFTKATSIYELLNSSCGIPINEFIHPIVFQKFEG